MALGDNIQVTEGSGKRLATGATYTENSQTVRDEKAIFGEQYLASYAGVLSSSVSLATANDHILQLMAGASLNVYVRRLIVYQSVLVTTAANLNFQFRRVTTAGTGGTAITPVPFDTADSASGATLMTLPTAKGTESSILSMFMAQLIQTVPTGGSGQNPVLIDKSWDILRQKCPRIPAGTANGLVLKNLAAAAGANVYAVIEFVEAPF